jgi:hypothetical protein
MEPERSVRCKEVEMKALSLTLVAVAAAALTAATAHAAAPRIVIFSGKPVAHQVVVSNWLSILRVVDQVAPAPVARDADLAGRPHLKVSMFWGPQWSEYLSEGKRASSLRPSQADQFGRFYPAWHGKPAVIALPWVGRWPRVVPSKALVLLDRFGVPTRLR